MSWVLGAGLGLLRGGPLGAVVGGVVQHFVTKKFQKSIKKHLSAVVDEGCFVTCLVAALTHICMGRDGITENQARLIHRFFVKNLNYDGQGLKYINEIIRESKRINPDLIYLADNYKKSTGSNYTLLLLALAYQIALIDGGGFTVKVEGRIHALASALSIDPDDHNRIRQKYSLETIKTSYNILGVPADASNEDIKKAYRQKLSQFHPDRVMHAGQDKVEDAHLMFLEVQAEYQELEKVRGF